MISSLRVQNFRSYIDAQFEFNDGVTIIVGPNGSGKTSLLEALLYTHSGASYKSPDMDVVRRDTPWSRIDTVHKNGDERSVKLEVVQEKDAVKKSYILNGAQRQRLLHAQKLPYVLFEPEDMNIITGEPAQRRDFIDAILVSITQGFEAHSKNYRRALAQRNTLLKRPTPPRPDELFVWDLRLSELGGAVHNARKQLLDNFAIQMSAAYEAISKKPDNVALSYISDAGSGDYAEGMLARLQAHYDKDIARGFTSVGPHRDDIQLTIRGQEAKVAASRGEMRSMLLALKMMHLQSIEGAAGVKPTVLLDDVFSELDGARRQALAALLKDYQSFITTTDADLVIEHFTDKASIVAL